MVTAHAKHAESLAMAEAPSWACARCSWPSASTRIARACAKGRASRCSTAVPLPTWCSKRRCLRQALHAAKLSSRSGTVFAESRCSVVSGGTWQSSAIRRSPTSSGQPIMTKMLGSPCQASPRSTAGEDGFGATTESHGWPVSIRRSWLPLSMTPVLSRCCCCFKSCEAPRPCSAIAVSSGAMSSKRSVGSSTRSSGGASTTCWPAGFSPTQTDLAKCRQALPKLLPSSKGTRTR
mmetsp:Transcript_104884/g.338207  ORF Transcript_104884/g.338207 Transcript_104884/m.338207 type:complete len:235 (-) Transcript_104884:336-1040(-)